MKDAIKEQEEWKQKDIHEEDEEYVERCTIINMRKKIGRTIRQIMQIEEDKERYG